MGYPLNLRNTAAASLNQKLQRIAHHGSPAASASSSSPGRGATPRHLYIDTETSTYTRSVRETPLRRHEDSPRTLPKVSRLRIFSRTSVWPPRAVGVFHFRVEAGIRRRPPSSNTHLPRFTLICIDQRCHATSIRGGRPHRRRLHCGWGPLHYRQQVSSRPTGSFLIPRPSPLPPEKSDPPANPVAAQTGAGVFTNSPSLSTSGGTFTRCAMALILSPWGP